MGPTIPPGERHDVARDHVMQPPYVVKPNAEGSSVGVFIVREGANGPPRELAASFSSLAPSAFRTCPAHR